MKAHLENGFVLGACEVRPGEHGIVRDGVTHSVEPKSMAVLVELASRGGDTVSREDILSAVWPRGYVTDDVLNRCISQLRSAFGDNPKSPSYIATVPRRGYRLVANVETSEQAVVDGILVLPFQNLAAHGMDEFLADGLTELLIARLAVALDQRVISRTTAMSFKGTNPDIGQIGEQLGVKWVIEGSLLQLDGQLQVVVQMIDAQTDAHAWAETWARPAGDIMGVLNEVTRYISNHINQHLAGDASVPADTGSLPDELMRRYLQGMHHASRRSESSLRQAIVCFKDVLDEHPDHAPALAGLALCHMLLVHYGAEPADEGVPRVRELSERALQIDPDNAEAMSHLAAVSFFYDWDFDKAAELAGAALEMKPNFEMAMLMFANTQLVKGFYEKSQSLVDKAISCDPLNIGLLMNAGDILMLQRRYGEAITCLSQALELEPRMRPARLRLALAHALHGQHERASEILAGLSKPGEEDAAYFEYRALVAGQAGKHDEARDAAEKLRGLAASGAKVLPWSLARAWAAAGDADKAIGYIEKAFETHASSMPFLGQAPVFHWLRDRPEVRELMLRVGLPV